MVLRASSAENLLKAQAKEAEERLLIEAAQKDPSRFAELYENNFERVYAYILRRVRNREEAEDLTSEVFHQALENIGRFEWRGVPFAAWLFRIAANAIVDRWKSAAKESGNPTREDPEEITEPDLDEIEHCAELFRLVNSLPADQRRGIEMRFTEEKSIREIAQGLRRTEGAVKQLQFRALQNLRTRMEGANA
jgi:RNA polymerase sigma-70 factor, ECF subfamily